MKTLKSLAFHLHIWKATRGQDLIEYALMAGFVAVAAGAIVPGIAESLKTIYGRINNVVSSSAAQN
ncbi:MAG: Flp family type IVb pilin [Candidatus Solibacter usitatus]|nr:Flp family type IVb pilin [Candidatus Solibacter usitatus]